MHKNCKYTIRKLLECSNKFGNIAGYKVNIKKFVAFLYSNNKLSKREIKETTSFLMAWERINYKGINLLKEAKDSYLEIYKTLKKLT